MSEPGRPPGTLKPDESGQPLSGLLQIAAAINSRVPLMRLLQIVARKTAQACQVQRCSIFLWRGRKLVPATTQSEFGGEPVGLSNAFRALGPYRLEDVAAYHQAFVNQGPVFVADVAGSGALPEGWGDRLRLRAVVVIPLFRAERFRGVLELGSTADQITEAQVWPASLIAPQLALAIDHDRLVGEIRQRFRDTKRLVDVAGTIGSTLDLREVMRRVAREAACAVGADTAGMYNLVQDARALQPLVGYHVPKHFLEFIRGGRLNVQDFNRLAGLFASGRSSVWSSDVPNDPAFDHAILRHLGMRSIFMTLLRAGTRTVGVLVCVWWKAQHRFGEHTLRLLEGIANQAAVALANANLYSQAEDLAVRRERTRVGEELHDTLNRSVFAAALKLGWCLVRIPEDYAELRAKLEEIKREMTSMMIQIRQLIYELVPDRASQVEINARIRALIEEVQDLSGIRVELVEQGQVGALPVPVQTALLRTLQEALANIVKHSQASRAGVGLEVLAEEVRLEVGDDGVGLAPGVDPERLWDTPGHIGLRQIRGWLQALDGQLELGNRLPTGFYLKGRIPIRAAHG